MRYFCKDTHGRVCDDRQNITHSIRVPIAHLCHRSRSVAEVRALPRLMVAPNGARRTKADHPALPITDAELIEATLACQAAGADGVHLHLRDANGAHLLDAGRYRALLDELTDRAQGLYLQVTSEAAGRYEAEAQRAMMRLLKPAHVSVAMREMVREGQGWSHARAFYHWAAEADVAVQHILYTPAEVRTFAQACESDDIPGPNRQIILVQGSYAKGSCDAIALEDYLEPFEEAGLMSDIDWMVCAFGVAETASLVRAAQLGGKARVGFENSLLNADGTQAKDNAERVREVDLAVRGLTA